MPAEEKEKVKEQDNERKSSYTKSLPAAEKEKVKEQEKEKLSLYRKALPDEEKEKVKEDDKNRKVSWESNDKMRGKATTSKGK